MQYNANRRVRPTRLGRKNTDFEISSALIVIFFKVPRLLKVEMSPSRRIVLHEVAFASKTELHLFYCHRQKHIFLFLIFKALEKLEAALTLKILMNGSTR